MYQPGNGMSLGKSLAAAAITLTAVIGLGVGLGVEGSKLSSTNSKLDDLKAQIELNKKIQSDINITPRSGFIN